MISKKKTWFVIVLMLMIFVFALYIWANNRESKGNFLHKNFYGTILSYEETEKGLSIVLDNDTTTSDRVFVITEDTMFEDDVLKQKIFSFEEGLYVEIASEYYSQDVEPQGIYPVTAIYLAR